MWLSYSAPFVPWTEQELERLKILWCKGYKRRWLRHKVEEVGGCKQLWNDQLWDLDREDWQLLWAGEEDFWKHVRAMVQAGFSRPALCPQELREMAEPEGLHWTELGKELPKGWRLRHIPQLEAALACSHRVTQEEWV